ncbi:MAG: energy-coupling factor ABC transporter ATP-binding protein [Candidatus Limnocylindrales bacterium]
MPSPILRTAGLGFVYPDGTRALSAVDLAVEPGQLLAIVGQNGSGKSTLVRHFNGLLRATEGQVEVAGREVGRQHVAALARTVGVAFQNPDRQIFSGRVRSEVAFGARNLGLGQADVAARVTEALATVGLAEAAETNPYDLGY